MRLFLKIILDKYSKTLAYLPIHSKFQAALIDFDESEAQSESIKFNWDMFEGEILSELKPFLVERGLALNSHSVTFKNTTESTATIFVSGEGSVDLSYSASIIYQHESDRSFVIPAIFNEQEALKKFLGSNVPPLLLSHSNGEFMFQSGGNTYSVALGVLGRDGVVIQYNSSTYTVDKFPF